ncbi:MAG: BatD family protein [Deltaproteobacteria bacterium]|nr:BatD family protein [Deltaproteobacteria bacterium]
MSRAALRLAGLLVAWFACMSQALAQSGVELHAAVSSEIVEVGEIFVVELTAMTSEQQPFSDPLLRLPAGLSANGPTVGSRTMVQMAGGGTSFRRGISAKWRLSASTVGRFTIPPPSVRVGGRTVTADAALRVSVVGSGQKPPTKAKPLDPFGLGSPFGSPFDDPLNEFLKDAAPKREADLIVDEPVLDLEALGPAGKALALTRGDDPYLFLRVVPDKTRVVVGEQITLRFLEYYRVTNERFDEREPKLPDFLKVPLDDEPGQSQRATTSVGGRLWFAQELDRIAVFPLRAGTLQTGAVSAQFRIPYLKNQTARRSSNDLVIEVREPPSEGRPAGYRVGDTGRFTVAATVAPRATLAGETVSVSIKVEGRGVMPNQLKLPERTGVEWLTPEKHDTQDMQAGRVGGSRTFGYAVRVLERGEVDLGWVELPHYDPEAREYKVARAALGTVRVTAKQGAEEPPRPGTAPEEDPFATLPRPRTTLQAFERAPSRAPSPGWLLGLALAPAALVLSGRALTRGVRALGERRRARQQEPTAIAGSARDELRAKEDPAAIAASAERAIHLALEAATGLRSRGVLVAELARELSARGLDAQLASRAQASLEALEAVRFLPVSAPGDAARLRADVLGLIDELLLIERKGAP